MLSEIQSWIVDAVLYTLSHLPQAFKQECGRCRTWLWIGRRETDVWPIHRTSDSFYGLFFMSCGPTYAYAVHNYQPSLGRSLTPWAQCAGSQGVDLHVFYLTVHWYRDLDGETLTACGTAIPNPCKLSHNCWYCPVKENTWIVSWHRKRQIVEVASCIQSNAFCFLSFESRWDCTNPQVFILLVQERYPTEWLKDLCFHLQSNGEMEVSPVPWIGTVSMSTNPIPYARASVRNFWMLRVDLSTVKLSFTLADCKSLSRPVGQLLTSLILKNLEVQKNTFTSPRRLLQQYQFLVSARTKEYTLMAVPSWTACKLILFIMAVHIGQ